MHALPAREPKLSKINCCHCLWQPSRLYLRAPISWWAIDCRSATEELPVPVESTAVGYREHLGLPTWVKNNLMVQVLFSYPEIPRLSALCIVHLPLNINSALPPCFLVYKATSAANPKKESRLNTLSEANFPAIYNRQTRLLRRGGREGRDAAATCVPGVAAAAAAGVAGFRLFCRPAAAPLLGLPVLTPQRQGLPVPVSVGPSKRSHRPSVGISFAPDGGGGRDVFVVDGDSALVVGGVWMVRRCLVVVEQRL